MNREVDLNLQCAFRNLDIFSGATTNVKEVQLSQRYCLLCNDLLAHVKDQR